MPCDAAAQTARDTDRQRELQAERARALAALEAALRSGQAQLTVDRVSGRLAIEGWPVTARGGWQDGCALAALQARGSETLQARLAALGATAATVRLTHGH